MNKHIAKTRDKIIRKVTGYDALALAEGLGVMNTQVKGIMDAIADQRQFHQQVSDHLHHLQAQVDVVEKLVVANNLLLKSQRDNIPALRQQLWNVRALPEYAKVLNTKQPLISVRIASYNKTDELMNVAIKSVLEQTYQNFEIVIVNDGPNDKTRLAIEKLADPRIRYYEFPQRSVYPADAHSRWMVAGSPGMNMGAMYAKGDWIAPLDDDDAFTPDHLEKLLAAALENQSEMAYGALILRNEAKHENYHIWSSPPELSHFSFQGAIYMKLLDFFQYDQESWLVGEPGDWNLCRRMLSAGVRMTAIKDVVATMNMVPYDSKKY